MTGQGPGSDRDVFKVHKYLCMAPFVHAHLSPLGDFTPCCEIFEPLGDSDGATLDSHWNSKAMAAFREAMLGDQPVASCKKCYAKEAVGLGSRRSYFNTVYRDESDRVGSLVNGFLPEKFKPVDFDLRFSNLCNFRCRSCWHGASSGWFMDAKKLEISSGPGAVITAGANREKILDQLENLLPGTRCIYFAGGESLLMDEHYLLLQQLIQRGRTDIILEYHTNLSSLRLGSHSVLELWKNFTDINVGISVDGMGTTGELIRKGMNWTNFEENLASIRRCCPHVNLHLAVTVSVLNLFHIPDFVTYAMDSLDFDVEDIHLNVLQEPEHYNIQLLPGWMKRKAEKKLSELVTTLPKTAERKPARNPSTSGGEDTILNIINFMYVKSRPGQIPKCIEITRKLDVLRKENTFRTIPDLEPLQSLSLKMQNHWGKILFCYLFILENQFSKYYRWFHKASC